jgi:hypothetical protein
MVPDSGFQSPTDILIDILRSQLRAFSVTPTGLDLFVAEFQVVCTGLYEVECSLRMQFCNSCSLASPAVSHHQKSLLAVYFLMELFQVSVSDRAMCGQVSGKSIATCSTVSSLSRSVGPSLKSLVESSVHAASVERNCGLQTWCSSKLIFRFSQIFVEPERLPDRI